MKVEDATFMEELHDYDYENSYPDAYATSVYSGPHWMVEADKRLAGGGSFSSKKPEPKQKPIPEWQLATGGSIYTRKPKRLPSGRNADVTRTCSDFIKSPPVYEPPPVYESQPAYNPNGNSLIVQEEIQSAINITPKTKSKRKRGDNFIVTPRKKKRMEVSAIESAVEVITSTKKKKHGKYRLYCEHCKCEFYSKATFRHTYGHHLVNHRCYNNVRMQYVVGVRHRRCKEDCDPNIGCIHFVRRMPMPRMY